VATRTSNLEDYLLGLVPLIVALVLGMLVLPRATPADDVPVPIADGRVLTHVHDVDVQLARTALAPEVRALGSALRAYNTLEAQQVTDPYVTPARMSEARSAIDHAFAALPGGDALDPALLALRAVQVEGFLGELRAFERTGKESPELIALGGGFVRRLRDVGWCGSDHELPMNESVRATMFKLEWDALLNVEHPGFRPGLDEQRELFAFYIRHPHAAEGTRKRIDEARTVAPSLKACAALADAETMAAEEWRLDKVRRIAAMDPAYPAAYAIGVARYRHKDYEASVQSFREWLVAHPDGAWTIRARNHLRAALALTTLD
jgi:hypothetical protein